MLQSGLTLCNPRDCSPAGSSVHRILQAGMTNSWSGLPCLPPGGVFLTQRWNLRLLCLLPWQEGPLPLGPPFTQSQTNYDMPLIKRDGSGIGNGQLQTSECPLTAVKRGNGMEAINKCIIWRETVLQTFYFNDHHRPCQHPATYWLTFSLAC